MKMVCSLLVCLLAFSVQAQESQDNKNDKDDGSKYSECANVAPKCIEAGYKPGGHKNDNKGLWVDCVTKLANGGTVDGVIGVSQLDANKCRAAKLGRNTGIKYPACAAAVDKCMSATTVTAEYNEKTWTGYFPGNHPKTGKGLWVDCIGKAAKGETVEGVPDITQDEAKACQAEKRADRDKDLKAKRKQENQDKKKKDKKKGGAVQ